MFKDHFHIVKETKSFFPHIWAILIIVGLVSSTALSVQILLMAHKTDITQAASFTNDCGTGSDDSSIGSIAWISTGSGCGSDDTRTTATINDRTHYLKTTGYGFAIPSDATILGIEATVERNDGTGIGLDQVSDNRIRIIKGGTIGSTDRSSGSNWPSTDGTVTYGNSTDLWGLSWTPADINAADFGLAISAEGSGLGIKTAAIDNVQITVYVKSANNCSAGADDSSVGTVTWTNPGNACGSDDSRATASVTTTTTHYLKATGFGFAIPSGATISGIEAKVERNDGTGSGGNQVSDNRVRIIKGGTIGSTDRSSGSSWPSTDGIATYGDSTDLWGLSWTPADINAANFGLAISARGSGSGTKTAAIDNIQMIVYYKVSNVCSVGADDSSIGEIAWSNIGNACGSDNSRATSLISDRTHYFTATNFGFSIPVGATIAGIEATVERNDGTGFDFDQVTDYRVRIIKGGIIGSDDKSSGDYWPSTDRTMTYGSSTDLWGLSWTPDDINAANFGLAISGNGHGFGTKTAAIDNVQITVYIADNVPPTGTMVINSDATYTTSHIVDLDLTCSDDNSGCDKIQVATDGICDTETFHDSDFVQEVDVSLPVGDGTKTVCIRYKDADGNISDPIYDSIILDENAPAIVSVVVTPNIIGTTAQINITKHITDAIGVTSVSADIKEVFSPYDVVGNVSLALISGTAQDGTWEAIYTFPDQSTAPDGIYRVMNTVSDSAGNSDTVGDGNVTLDRTAPSLSLTSIIPDLVKPGTDVTVKVSASDETTGFSGTGSVIATDTTTSTPAVFDSFTGSLDPDTTGNWTFVQSTAIPDGIHDEQIDAADVAGNTATIHGSFTVDSTPPDTIIDTMPPAVSNSTSADFTFHSTEDPSTFQCQLDGDGYYSCTSPQSFSGLAEGPHTFDVKAKDEVGNEDETPATYTWTVDSDGDGVGAGDQCPYLFGEARFFGCTAAISEDDTIQVLYKLTNKSGLSFRGYACIQGGKQRPNCDLPLKLGPLGDSRGQEIVTAHKKIYKLSDLTDKTFAHISTMCSAIYDGMTPFNAVIPVNEGDEITATEMFGVPGPNNYVIIKRVSIHDPGTNADDVTTICKPVYPKDFRYDFDANKTRDPVARRQLKIIKTVRPAAIELMNFDWKILDVAKGLFWRQD